MDILTKLLERYRPTARHLFSGEICGPSNMRYAGDQAYLHILQSGRLTIKPESGQQVTLDEPSIIFYPAFRQHELIGDLANPAKMTCATIEFGSVGVSPVTKLTTSTIIFRLSDYKQLESCASLLRQESTQRSLGWLGAVDGLFSYITTLLIREFYERGEINQSILNSGFDRQIEKALIAIHDRPESNWSLISLAQECAMSRASFAKKFLDVTGTTPIEYLTSYRLILAKELMRRGESIKVASMRTGFSSISVFSRSFMRTEGVSPKTWLSQILQKPA